MAESAGATDTNFINDLSYWQLELDAYELKGDPRSAWSAMGICLEMNLPIPEWVRSYFLVTCNNFRRVSRAQSPLRLWETLGLSNEKKRSQYDPLQDPEEIYEKIEAWKSSGQVKSVSAGSIKYRDEILDGNGNEHTIRSKYMVGRKLWRAYDPGSQ